MDIARHGYHDRSYNETIYVPFFFAPKWLLYNVIRHYSDVTDIRNKYCLSRNVRYKRV